MNADALVKRLGSRARCPCCGHVGDSRVAAASPAARNIPVAVCPECAALLTAEEPGKLRELRRADRPRLLAHSHASAIREAQDEVLRRLIG